MLQVLHADAVAGKVQATLHGIDRFALGQDDPVQACSRHVRFRDPWRSEARCQDQAQHRLAEPVVRVAEGVQRSEEHTSELQSLMSISYAVFCLKKKTQRTHHEKY